MAKKRGARSSPRRKARPPNPGIVPYREVPAFLRALRRAGAADPATDALECLILTATRSKEALDARLSDVSTKDATWTLTAERIKSITPRVVPLSARALAIFIACKERHSCKGDFIFESAPGHPLNGTAMLLPMRRIRATGVPHGFLYCFRSWARDRGLTPGEIAKASRRAGRRWANGRPFAPARRPAGLEDPEISRAGAAFPARSRGGERFHRPKPARLWMDRIPDL